MKKIGFIDVLYMLVVNCFAAICAFCILDIFRIIFFETIISIQLLAGATVLGAITMIGFESRKMFKEYLNKGEDK